ncbi:HNH endonuclease signature motif containing protein [Burkholderia sp. TSV86]|uniref:HNH endonuclease signature motif containing protein n=1 Tax=Burkholderia sp. TSV86 TaxID=1385594 RepID=UPI0009EAF10A|nr:HNH endonuclease signature motif containing protein [Burkholderia sp. TSV86]
MRRDVNASRVRELLFYDEFTGAFSWQKSMRAVKAGMVAGSNNGKGYIQISVDGVRYAAHRLAWLYMHGSWPAREIDHIDGNRSNNAISNLREADRSLNNRNIRRARITNKLGILGVHRRGEKFIAQIRANGRELHLGCFQTPEEAREAYLRAKEIHHSLEA